jgi:hypothetical protein
MYDIQIDITIGDALTTHNAYRDSNKCVNVLANIECPSQIRELLLADVLGITTPRLISV